LAGDFSYHSVISPLREKSRSARLFGCKRPHGGSAATNFLRVCALRRWRFILSHPYKNDAYPVRGTRRFLRKPQEKSLLGPAKCAKCRRKSIAVKAFMWYALIN